VAGRDPLKLLEDKTIDHRPVSWPSVAGRDPLKLLYDKTRELSPVNWPSVAGRDPLKLLFVQREKAQSCQLAKCAWQRSIEAVVGQIQRFKGSPLPKGRG